MKMLTINPVQNLNLIPVNIREKGQTFRGKQLLQECSKQKPLQNQTQSKDNNQMTSPQVEVGLLSVSNISTSNNSFIQKR
jgi:hypothetical protein